MADHQSTSCNQCASQEAWRSVPGLNGYEASSRGRLRRSVPGRQTSAGRVIGTDVKNRYSMASVKRGGSYRSESIHPHVAAAFLGERPSGFHVNHIDGDKHHNCPSNLEYVTPRDNALHSFRTGLQNIYGEACNFAELTESTVRRIHASYASGETLASVSAAFGVSKTHVCEIIKGKSWPHLGLSDITRRKLDDVLREAIGQRGDVTTDELTQATAAVPRLRNYQTSEAYRQVVFRAIHRMKSAGVVERVPHGDRKCRVSGRTCATWRLKERG